MQDQYCRRYVSRPTQSQYYISDPSLVSSTSNPSLVTILFFHPILGIHSGTPGLTEPKPVRHVDEETCVLARYVLVSVPLLYFIRLLCLQGEPQNVLDE